MYDMQSEVTRLRDEVANLAKVASMAHDEAQQVGLRMDQMEHEWLAWGDPPQQPRPQGGSYPPIGVPLTLTVPTPQDLSPRTQEAYLQRPLLELEDDPLTSWYNNSGTPGVNSSALIHAPPQAAQGPMSLSPLGGERAA